MKKVLLSLILLSVFMLSVVPGVLAVSTGSGIGVDIITEDFEPRVWMCEDRVVYDDGTEPGRVSQDGYEMVERINNYAFEGEQIQWKVLVFDKNGIEKVKDVYGALDGNIEVNCQLDKILDDKDRIDDSCNARILEEELHKPGYDNVAAYYTCTYTVESPPLTYGEYWLTVEAEDLDGLIGVMDEKEYWFLNPEIRLDIDGSLVFEDVRPGTSSYSNTLLVGNDADVGSGVMLDMFISGTDFYDSSSSGAKCPVSNQLELENFRYFATNGAYSSRDDSRSFGDPEDYVEIEYGVGFNDPNPFYNNNEIIQAQQVGPYYTANLLAPGAEMALTFRLDLPEPCNGDFDSGSIYFWGEAI